MFMIVPLISPQISQAVSTKEQNSLSSLMLSEECLDLLESFFFSFKEICALLLKLGGLEGNRCLLKSGGGC